MGSLRKRPTRRARLKSRTTASSGMRHIVSSYTSYTHVYLATRGCRCSPVGPRRAPDPPVKELERLRETHIHARQRRACVGHLAQSSRPQTVSAAVWARDQRPAEKWSGQGRTSRTGDAASALYMDSDPPSPLYWENNHANFGGAIYVYDNIPIRYCGSYSVRVTSESFTPKEECFFQLPDQNMYSTHGVYVKLVFKNNSADAAGNVLYGGVIDNCNLLGMDSYILSGKLFDMIVYIENDNKISNISSLPFHICLCTNNFPNCGSYNYPRTVYPGEIFQVPLVAVGQRYGAVPSRVVSGINNIQNPGTNLLDSQYWLQQANSACTMFNYRVFSLSQQVVINLHPESSPCSTYYDKRVTVTLNQTCPPGFNISESERSCMYL